MRDPLNEEWTKASIRSVIKNLFSYRTVKVITDPLRHLWSVTPKSLKTAVQDPLLGRPLWAYELYFHLHRFEILGCVPSEIVPEIRFAATPLPAGFIETRWSLPAVLISNGEKVTLPSDYFRVNVTHSGILFANIRLSWFWPFTGRKMGKFVTTRVKSLITSIKA